MGVLPKLWPKGIQAADHPGRTPKCLLVLLLVRENVPGMFPLNLSTLMSSLHPLSGNSF